MRRVNTSTLAFSGLVLLCLTAIGQAQNTSKAIVPPAGKAARHARAPARR